MESDRFDSLTRQLTHASPRRAMVGLVAGTALSAVSLRDTRDAESKLRKRRCKACRKLNKHLSQQPPNVHPCNQTASLGVGTVCEAGNCRPGATTSCSANNDFCAQQWAHCQDNPTCGCFLTVENFAICGNVADFSGCPATTGCTSSNDCGSETSFCVSLPCCPDGKSVCRPLCVS